MSIILDALGREHPRISAIEWYGHSLSNFGSSVGTNSAVQRASSMVGAECRDRSHGGARLAFHEQAVYETGGNGGWAEIYRWTEMELASSLAIKHAPYEALRAACSLWFAMNDLATLGPGNLGPLTNSYRACISRLRAAALFENDDASLSYPDGGYTTSGPSTATPRLKYQSGLTYAQVAAAGVGKRVQVQVPADFGGAIMGEAVALSFTAGADGSGAVWDFTVDGDAAGSIDTRDSNAKDAGTGANGKITPVVKRFTDLTAGAHTIVATPSAINLNAYFDCWWIEGRTKPLIMLPLANRAYSFAGYASGPYTPVDADVATLNALIEGVGAEFDNVIYPDIEPAIDKDPDLFLTDGIHFNDEGHAIVAEVFYDALTKRPRTRAGAAAGNARAPTISKNPHLSSRNEVKPTSPRQSALFLRGTPAGDQTGPLLSVLSDGSSVAPAIALGRTLLELTMLVAGNAGHLGGAGSTVGDLIFNLTDDTKGITLALGGFQQLRLTTASMALSGQKITGLGLGTEDSTDAARMTDVAERIPWRREISPWIGADGINGTWAFLAVASQLYGNVIYNSSAAIGNYVEFDIQLSKGTWSLMLIAYKANNNGQLTPKLGLTSGAPGSLTALGAAWDMYAAATTLDQSITYTGISVTQTNKYRLRLECTGKNASSSSNIIPLCFILLKRTA